MKKSERKFLLPGLPFLACLFVALAQFFLRKFDDNNLTNWNLIFLAIRPTAFFTALPAGLILAVLSLRISLPPRARRAVLFSCCAVAAAFCWGVPEVNVDASRYFAQAKHLELYGIGFFLREWGKSIPAWTDLPAMPFIYGLIFKFLGETRLFIQLLTSFLFAMTAVLTSLIGRELWDEDTGLLAGALLLGMPYLLVMTPLMLVDVPMMFFLSLSLYLFIRALEAGGAGRIGAAVAAVFFTTLCKYSTWPMLSVLPVLSIVYCFRADKARRREFIRRSVVILVFSFVLVGAVVALKFDVFAGQFKLLMNFQRPGLGRWGENFSSTFFFQINPIITAAAAASLVIALWKRDFKYLIVLWLSFLIFFFQIRRIRYTLPSFPMLALMASYGLSALRDSGLRKALAASVIAASLATVFFAFVPFLKQVSAVNLSEAGAFLDTLDVDTVEVFPLPEHDYPINPAVNVPLLDLSTHKKIVFTYEPGLSTADEDYHRSPFRFSWEYKNPKYYDDDTKESGEKRALVLISSRENPVLTPELREKFSVFRHSKSFHTAYIFFQYQSMVTILW